MKSIIFSIVLAFLIVVAICPFLIPYLQRLKLGQAVRELGPRSHFQKAGTPTMGGVAIILAVMIASIIVSGMYSPELQFALCIVLIFGLIGFVDDFIKVIQKNIISQNSGISSASLGMTAKHKLVLQTLTSLALGVYVAYHPDMGTSIIIPFTDFSFNLGILFIPFIMVATIAIVNAVNLTDGLDGLACGATLIISIFFMVQSFVLGVESMSVLSATVIGACLAFLIFNRYPAKIFMGDTGSMALGGALAVVSIMTQSVLFILIAGALLVIETLSVTLQVGYFKLSKGKRLFKMAPIHHHFELSGWKETKVVIVFWAFTLLCVILSFFAANII